ncbi:MAG TPA: hypothetical protein VGJ94_01280 [Syntrophorhabdaceae bacterium]|jgi:hypothetical protein
MATFKVIFKNRLNMEGQPFDLPADKLNANGAMIEFYGYGSREIRTGENFARDTWDYQVRDKDVDRFIEGLKSTPTVLEYKQVQDTPEE